MSEFKIHGRGHSGGAGGGGDGGSAPCSVPMKVAWVPRHVVCRQLRVGQSWGEESCSGRDCPGTAG